MSVADVHLKLLDRAFNQIRFLLPSIDMSLRHRRRVGFMTHFLKIFVNHEHPLHDLLPPPAHATLCTRSSVRLGDHSLSITRASTSQFSRSFFQQAVRLWNDLPSEVVEACDSEIFKARVNAFLLS